MYICACMCVFVNEANVSLMNSLLITTTDMGYCIITFLLLFKLTYHFTEIIQANSLVLAWLTGIALWFSNILVLFQIFLFCFLY